MKQAERAEQVGVRYKFGRYRKDGPKKVRNLRFGDNTLDVLYDAWNSLVMKNGYYYDSAEKVVQGRKLAFDTDEIERFSVALEALQEDGDFSKKAGALLTFLIKYGLSSTYRLDTTKLHEPIDSIYKEHEKDIIVKGNLGEGAIASCGGGTVIIDGNVLNGAFFDMRGGLAIITGSATDSPGLVMRDGTLVILGDAMDNVGDFMQGGVIRVKGNARRDIGNEMTGGEIHIDGDFQRLNDKLIKHGKIFHKGKLIVDK